MIPQKLKKRIGKLVKAVEAAVAVAEAERAVAIASKDRAGADTLAEVQRRLDHAGDELKTAAELCREPGTFPHASSLVFHLRPRRLPN